MRNQALEEIINKSWLLFRSSNTNYGLLIIEYGWSSSQVSCCQVLQYSFETVWSFSSYETLSFLLCCSNNILTGTISTFHTSKGLEFQKPAKFRISFKAGESNKLYRKFVALRRVVLWFSAKLQPRPCLHILLDAYKAGICLRDISLSCSALWNMRLVSYHRQRCLESSHCLWKLQSSIATLATHIQAPVETKAR